MDAKTIATIGATVFVAFAGFLAAYLNNLRLTQRKDRLDRVSRQLSDFYGPLLALASTGSSTWELFRTRYRPEGSFWHRQPSPSDEEAHIWRLWMTEVFMPLNRRMVEVIRSKADLLDDAEVPQCLLDVCSHVASYEPVLKRWEGGDFRENTPLANFPARELLQYLSESFLRLKANQQSLLKRGRLS
jgi:hypothetical protein